MKLNPIRFMTRCRSSAPRLLVQPEPEPDGYDGPVCPVCRNRDGRRFTIRILNQRRLKDVTVCRIRCLDCDSLGTIVMPNDRQESHVYWGPVDNALRIYAHEQAQKENA